MKALCTVEGDLIHKVGHQFIAAGYSYIRFNGYRYFPDSLPSSQIIVTITGSTSSTISGTFSGNLLLKTGDVEVKDTVTGSFTDVPVQQILETCGI
jgi:hypothetical protein